MAWTFSLVSCELPGNGQEKKSKNKTENRLPPPKVSLYRSRFSVGEELLGFFSGISNFLGWSWMPERLAEGFSVYVSALLVKWVDCYFDKLASLYSQNKARLSPDPTLALLSQSMNGKSFSLCGPSSISSIDIVKRECGLIGSRRTDVWRALVTSSQWASV